MEQQKPKFYELIFSEKLKQLSVENNIPIDSLQAFNGLSGLTIEQADKMVENTVGLFSLPLGIARNFIINGREIPVPMAIEEPSVIAGASFMAKLARINGGFTATTTAPEMIGQLQLLEVRDLETTRQKILGERNHLLELAAESDPVLTKLGGGPRDLLVRIIEDSSIGAFLVIHLIYDVRDAMGANILNTALEKIAPKVAQISGARVHLRILSNLADRRLARATCSIPESALAFGKYSGETVREGILEACAFAQADPYRAATHNKGIMNGVDAVVLATGNDWRAVEAGAHAYAARSGQYTSLSTWSKDENGNLRGLLEMPMAVGIVGGATQVHPTAQAALKLMKIQTAAQLAEIIVSVGLAQNLAALRALSTEGIQRGHMELHARQVAVAAGAKGDDVDRLARQLSNENKIRIDRAEQILKEWRNE
ncbi:MAG: hydroxymethylglutaryl-CoA reductase, degradative [Chloroflexi bacterium]|nr:hydroxymethylglutaryl-CoA reductase, degradative [Chloroflexota bacterium]